ncbi:MAG: RloB domain-containing protein [Nanoarchaeota archaeon]
MSKKIVHIYCEGDSEKNYFEALKGNKIISNNYVLKPNSKTNDIVNAIRKSKFLKGLSVIIVYVYDSDTFKNQKKITDEIKEHKNYIYFSEENFEGFLDCHKTRKVYRDKKPNLSRQLIEEIRNLDKSSLQKCIKKPKKFKDFKSIYDLLDELFEQKF